MLFFSSTTRFCASERSLVQAKASASGLRQRIELTIRRGSGATRSHGSWPVSGVSDKLAQKMRSCAGSMIKPSRLSRKAARVGLDLLSVSLTTLCAEAPIMRRRPANARANDIIASKSDPCQSRLSIGCPNAELNQSFPLPVPHLPASHSECHSVLPRRPSRQ